MNDITANQINEARPMPVGRRVWLRWLMAGLLGWGLGGTLGVALGTPGYIIENGFMSISLGGILTGMLQWLSLRRTLSPAGWWVPASIIAAVVFGAVVFSGLAIDTRIATDVAWITGASLFAAVPGLLQWRLVLRKHIKRGAGWWVLAGPVGFLAAGAGAGLATAPLGLTGKEGGLDAVVVWTMFGAIYGAVTGAVLVRLLRGALPGTPSDGELQAGGK